MSSADLLERPAGGVPAVRGTRIQRKPLVNGRVVAGVSLGALLQLGFALRVWMLRSPVGAFNSDEAQTGIQALELLKGHAWIFVPGVSYGGNLEAWLDAPFAALFGASPLRLKLATTIVWLASAAVVYRVLGRRLGHGAALIGAAVVWLPGAALINLSTNAYPGYGTGLLASAVTVALAYPLLEGTLSARSCAMLGLAAGLAAWQHPLHMQVAMPFTLAVLVRHRREFRSCWLPLAAGGIVALAIPLGYNIVRRFPSLETAPLTPYRTRVVDFFIDAFPRAVGAKWRDDVIILGTTGTVFVVLAGGALLVAALVVARRGPVAARVAAIATLTAPFTIPVVSGAWDTGDDRYMLMMLLPIAIVVAHAVARLPQLMRGGRPALIIVVWAMLTTVVPLVHHLGSTPSDPDVGLRDLVRVLDDNSITAVRADWWVAYRLAYQTKERVATSPVLPVKFQRYERLVAQAEREGTAALVVFTPAEPDVLAGRPPYERFGAYRTSTRLRVSNWTVFMPPAQPTPVRRRGVTVVGSRPLARHGI